MTHDVVAVSGRIGSDNDGKWRAACKQCGPVGPWWIGALDALNDATRHAHQAATYQSRHAR